MTKRDKSGKFTFGKDGATNIPTADKGRAVPRSTSSTAADAGSTQSTGNAAWARFQALAKTVRGDAAGPVGGKVASTELLRAAKMRVLSQSKTSPTAPSGFESPAVFSADSAAVRPADGYVSTSNSGKRLGDLVGAQTPRGDGYASARNATFTSSNVATRPATGYASAAPASGRRLGDMFGAAPNNFWE